MTRFSSADALVTLPRMSAAEAIALGTSLEAAAVAYMNGPPVRPLPGAIGPKFQRMVAGRDALADAARGRLVSTSSDTPQAKAADRVLDRMWSGTRSLCNAYRMLPRNVQTAPLIDSAEALWQAFFRDSLMFTKIRFELQWVESKHRLDLVPEKGLDIHFQRLNAGVFLTELLAAQDAYGKALGLTEVISPESTGVVRPALDMFATVLKSYVVGVNGHADPDIPGSQELAASLLAPLDAWKPAPSSAPDDEPDDEEPEPTP